MWHALLTRTGAGRLRVRPATPSPARTAVPLKVTELEDRILMSAVPLAADALLDADPENHADIPESAGHGVDRAEALAAPGPRPSSDAATSQSADLRALSDLVTHDAGGRRELCVIDPSVSGYEELIRHLTEQHQGAHAFDIVTLAADQDGIAQITHALAASREVDAVHVFAHGAGGALRLGSTWLSADRLPGYTSMIAGWADALAPGADILFYTCDLAATPEGLAVLDGIQALTGADVAASTDATGHLALGGNWDLEYRHGDVTTASALGAEARAQWTHLLAAEHVADNFFAKSFAGNDGSTSWSGDWQELGESDGTDAGAVQVVNHDLGPDGAHSLHLQALDAHGVVRELDLSAATSAILSFDWQRHPLDGFANAVLRAQISADGGSSWNTLATIGDGMDAAPSTSVYDISAYAAANTQVRFLIAGSGTGSIYVDQISISYETPTVPLNQAPILTPGEPWMLSHILEDETANGGSTVASILASAGDDRVTDGDAGALEGMAVIGIDNRFGTWQFDALGDGNWRDFVTVSDQAAVLLGENSLIRFVPQANYHGADSQMQFRAWDQTTGAVGDMGVDVSVNGGTTAFSADVGVAGVEVLPIDDAPLIHLPPGLQTEEDTPLAIAELAVQSVDASDTEMQVVLTVSHGTLAMGNTTGLTFSGGDGSAGSELTFTGLIADINIALATLVYQPLTDFHGQDTLGIRVSDWTAGGGPQLSTSDALAIDVVSVNDPPVASPQQYAVRGDGVLDVAGPGILHDATDVDGDALSAVLVRAPRHGKLELNADGSFRYVPEPGFLGTDSFAFRAWDGESYSSRTRVTINVLVPTSPVDPSSTVPGNTTPGALVNPSASPSAISGLPVPLNAEVSHFMAQEHASTSLRPRERGMLRLGAEPLTSGLTDHQASVSVSSAGDETAGNRGSARAYAADELWDETRVVAEPSAPAMPVDATATTSVVVPQDLTRIAVQLEDHGLWHRWMVGSALGVTTGLTVGYVLWTIRAGYLLTSLIVQMPTWRFIDPLPILNSFDRQTLAADGESLSSIAQAADAHRPA